MAKSRNTDMMRRSRRRLSILLAVGMTASALAPASRAVDSGAAPKRAWSIEPSISLVETFTDNVNVGQADEEGDLITEVRPAIRVRGDTARLKVNADYSLRGILYANNSDENQIQHALNASGTLEAVEDWLYLDASGVVTQQNISAFGATSPGDASINDNVTQTANFRLSPYIRGRLGGFANYQVRYSRSWTRADSSDASDADLSDWSGNLRGDTPYARLGWSLDGGLQSYDYSNGRNVESDRLRGLLTYRHAPQLSFSASLGRESNDFVSLEKETYTTHGYGFDWRPTERTAVSAFKEKRFFGDGHSFKVSHRMPLSAIEFSDSRDVSALPSQLTTVGLGSIYDLLYSQLASSIPDETQRQAFIDGYLAANNIPADTQVTGGFLASQVSVQRRQTLSFLLRGARNTLTLSLNRSASESIATIALGDDFDTYSDITQQGLAVTWSHRLSPLSSLSANVGYSESKGSLTGGGEDESSTTNLTVTWSTKLGARSNASVALRRAEYDGISADSYTENALVGTLSVQF
jgi:uncharacterized protein (PEP-CTERM system associated)